MQVATMARFKIRPGLRIVEVEPPYELVGGFLTMEAGSRVCGEILEGIRRVREGLDAEYSAGWNAHEVRVRADSVQVVEYAEYVGKEEDLTCEIPLEEFAEIVAAWNQRIRRWENRSP
jgi:hypothetical protein